ncbi:MAG: ATP-binding protein [Methanobrevibacter sp.]|nr:ATP-binding protein [Candidatus Methanoflexus mossambicus]
MAEIFLSANSQELDRLLNFLNDNLSQINLSLPIQMQLELVIEEIFINIVNYAFTDDLKDNSTQNRIFVGIELKNNPLKVIIIFKDDGIQFNPLKHEDPNISMDIDNREIGGLGILLVKKNVDKIEYKYENGKNILTLEKNIKC